MLCRSSLDTLTDVVQVRCIVSRDDDVAFDFPGARTSIIGVLGLFLAAPTKAVTAGRRLDQGQRLHYVLLFLFCSHTYLTYTRYFSEKLYHDD